MEYPEHIISFDLLYDLEHSVEPPGWVEGDQSGAVSIRNTEMWVCTDYSEVQQFNTLWHESLHTVLDALGITLSEKQVSLLSMGTICLLRHNPILREPPGCETEFELEIEPPEPERPKKST
jgi:hypothetical protein